MRCSAHQRPAARCCRCLRHRLESWTARGAELVGAATCLWLSERLAGSDTRDVRRVPCHADFGPRNWLWDDASRLSVIDFEHARPDLWLVDVLRLVDGPWLGRPELEEAFWQAYGRVPDEVEMALSETLRGLHALGTVVWGREHGDTGFEAEGWSVLERLGAPVPRAPALS